MPKLIRRLLPAREREQDSAETSSELPSVPCLFYFALNTNTIPSSVPSEIVRCKDFSVILALAKKYFLFICRDKIFSYPTFLDWPITRALLLVAMETLGVNEKA